LSRKSGLLPMRPRTRITRTCFARQSTLINIDVAGSQVRLFGREPNGSPVSARTRFPARHQVTNPSSVMYHLIWHPFRRMLADVAFIAIRLFWSPVATIHDGASVISNLLLPMVYSLEENAHAGALSAQASECKRLPLSQSCFALWIVTVRDRMPRGPSSKLEDFPLHSNRVTMFA
jgi:hypothetical protein